MRIADQHPRAKLREANYPGEAIAKSFVRQAELNSLRKSS
jgi:hypothetical protein